MTRPVAHALLACHLLIFNLLPVEPAFVKTQY